MLSLFSLGLAAAPAAAQDIVDLFNERPPQIMHTSGLFTFVPPNGWDCHQNKDSSVECRTNNAGAAGTLFVTHSTIQGVLDSELMALNSEKDLKKLPHYQRVGGGRILLGELKASIRSFVFDYQGNTEYPVAVEQLYVVSGSKAIKLHFETMRRTMPGYARDLKLVYDTFSVGEVDALGQVVKPAELRGQKRGSEGGKGKRGGGVQQLP